MLAVALTAAPAHAQRAELDKIIKRRVLANGLEVIVVENHGVPLATVEIDVKNGSFTQSPEYAGLAHMVDHLPNGGLYTLVPNPAAKEWKDTFPRKLSETGLFASTAKHGFCPL